MKRAALILTLSALLGLLGSPVQAGSEQGPLCSNGVDDDGDGLVDCEDRDCKQECQGGGGGGGELNAQGAVGHALDCLPLPCDDPNKICAVGDFYDVGTVETGCELLTCGGGRQNVVCGRKEDPKPRLDISGLYPLWGAGGQGDPEQCFGSNGIIDATVHTADQGKGGQIQVLLFFRDEVDGTLGGRCSGATNLVSYVVEIEGCTTPDTYPPPAGQEATITCPSGATVSVKTEGGGGIAKKCGCIATGTVATSTDINFLGQ